MNAYLSRDEKENMVRLMTLKVQLEKIIELYESLGNVDKKFLAELRHSRSRLDKGVLIRLGYLDETAQANLYNSITKIRLLFLPTPEAIKAHKELLEVQSRLPIEADDFQDWVAFMINLACRRCTRCDYENCDARRVMMKYDMFPIDPGATNKCQYSYVGTEAADELEPAPAAETVPADRYNQALAELAAARAQLQQAQEAAAAAEENWNQERLEFVVRLQQPDPELDELRRENQIIAKKLQQAELKAETLLSEKQAVSDRLQRVEEDCKTGEKTVAELIAELEEAKKAAAAAPVPAPKLTPAPMVRVDFGLLNGSKLQYTLPRHMASLIMDDLKVKRAERGICASNVGDEFIAVDLQEVVLIRAAGVVAEAEQPADGEPAQVDNPTTAAAPPAIERMKSYLAQCKCGAEYNFGLHTPRDRGRCRECGATIFADHTADVGPDKTLMTNRYWVERQPYAPRPLTRPAIGGRYTDPIRIDEGA